MDDVVRLVRWIASYFHSSNSTSAALIDQPFKISYTNRFGRFRIFALPVFLRNDSHGVQLPNPQSKNSCERFAGAFNGMKIIQVMTSTPEVSPAKNRWRKW